MKKPAIRYIRSPTFISNFHLVPSPAIFTKKKKNNSHRFHTPVLKQNTLHPPIHPPFSFLSFSFSFSLFFHLTNQTTRSNLPSPFLTIFSFFKAALGGQGASKTSFNSSNVRPLVSTPMKYHMIPTTKKNNQLTKKNVCVGRRRRTISKIQRDKNQIIFPRDGFECDGGDVGVVEICRVVHYDVLANRVLC